MLQAALASEEAAGHTLVHHVRQLSNTAQSNIPINLPETDATWVIHYASCNAAQKDLQICQGRQAFLAARILKPTDVALAHGGAGHCRKQGMVAPEGEHIKITTRKVAATRTAATTRPREDSPHLLPRRTKQRTVSLTCTGQPWCYLVGSCMADNFVTLPLTTLSTNKHWACTKY
jgi:hypothetical protein